MGLFDKIVSMVGDNISGGTENKGLLQHATSLIESPEDSIFKQGLGLLAKHFLKG